MDHAIDDCHDLSALVCPWSSISAYHELGETERPPNFVLCLFATLPMSSFALILFRFFLFGYQYPPPSAGMSYFSS